MKPVGHALKIGAETRAEAAAAPHVVVETRVKEITAKASRVGKKGADEAEENREEGVAEEEGTATPEEPRSIGYVFVPFSYPPRAHTTSRSPRSYKEDQRKI